MRWHRAIALLAAVALGGVASSCDRSAEVVPDPDADHARGNGTRLALEVGASSVTMATGLASRPLPTCRIETPSGPVTVDTRVTIALKGAVGESRRYDHERQWRRDASGGVSSSTRLVVPLPDGRRSERTAELVRIGDERWSAVDGRFADAARVPAFDRTIEHEARLLVDDVLSRVARGAEGLQTARGDGLCPALRAHEPLDALLTGRVAIDAASRTGALRWTHDDGAEIHVVFDERVTPGADPVSAPSEVWPVDADRSWASTTAFVEAAHAAGWLREGSAAPTDDTLVIDPAVTDQ